MKKALLSLLILALVMIPVLVSCEDTSQLEKIGNLMSDFSGVGKVNPEQAKKQTEQATSQIEEKFKEENLENLDFKEISDMFYDFPAADLENTKTSIDKGKLNKLISDKIPQETREAMEEAKKELDEMVKPEKIQELGLPDGVAEDVVGKISDILEVFTNITSDTESTGERATLKDVKQASAAASMYGELAGIADKFSGLINEGEGGEGSGEELTEEQTAQLLSDLMTGLDNYNNAAKSYAEAVGQDASEFTIDLESLAGQFLGE